ncbi:MAG TPA: limonene-1,2-epoxide hydrolase family protein [Acidimicrobiales bacterium]|nr:limonene-1,2-epoxide hydrolase family protein [Acidimicrobiales bacterium]
MANEDVLREVLRAWEEGIAASQQAFREHFTDDCRWEQAGMPTTTGPEEAAQLVGTMEQMGFTNMAVEFRNVAVAGDVVFTERVDWLVRADGTRLGPWPVVGVTEFRDGKISAWREYFDSRNLDMLGG